MTADRTQPLELVEATAPGFGWDPSHAWCPGCLKPMWRNNAGLLECADLCADAVDGDTQ